MLEKMDEFFDNRADTYDKHQLSCIFAAKEFYPYTANCLPKKTSAKVLDLGCGTGLELEEYFSLNPQAQITGIDLAPGMLDALRKKFSDKSLTLILGSYFDVLFGQDSFDAAVSVESLHHFTKEEKIPLYVKLRKSLNQGGYFILTDYFSLSDQEELFHRQEFLQLKKQQNVKNNEIFHFDTPLTVAHEKQALIAGGFSQVVILKRWGATFTLKASK